jgi:oligosaccharide repeat unit polymerase
MPIIFLYAMLFKNVKFKYFSLFLILGIIAMWGFQNIRSKTDFSMVNPIVLISDLTIPARSTYNAIEYTEQYGYTYGKTMSLGLLGVVPFLPSLVTGGHNTEFGSAELLTDYTNTVNNIPLDYRIGLGTTIIGDIYLSFGLIGVILLMYFLGRFINRYLLQTLSMKYHAIIIMAGMLANCVFLVRASYTHAVRYVLWALIIAYINKYLIVYFEKNNNIHSDS